MEFEGLVMQLLPLVKGQSPRGEWVKQEVIFEQAGEFGKKVCVSFWGDKTIDVATLKPGDKVKVSANIESREYNGRWYTEVRAWKMSKDISTSVGGTSDYVREANALSTSENIPPVSNNETYKEEFDDLPF